MAPPQAISKQQDISSLETKFNQINHNNNNNNNSNNNNNHDAEFEITLKESSNQHENAYEDQSKDDDDCKISEPIKCSAVHTLERDMPNFDYSNLVVELRRRILNECEQNPGMFSQTDVNKCKTDDWHLSRFLLRHKLDVDAALDMLKKAMRFKHENLCHSLRVQDFPAEFYQVGGVFGYEPDRKGNLMLYIRVKIHRKIPEVAAVFQAFLYYNIERLDEQANGRGISLVFDCSGAGLASADMDILFMLISTLTNYFPKGFSYLLVHNLPWILKPFWHIAKAWVSEEHRQLVKFSNERTIYEYVDRDNLPDFMGGTCKRDYRQPPADCTTLEEAAKLWGIGRDVVKRILLKFADYLPPDSMQRFLDHDSKVDSNNKNHDHDQGDKQTNNCDTSIQHNNDDQENRYLDN